MALLITVGAPPKKSIVKSIVWFKRKRAGLLQGEVLMELAKLRFHCLRQEGEEFPCSCLWDFIRLKQVVSSNLCFKAVMATIRVESQRSQRRAALLIS
jgi:hypothetical protein